MNHLRKILPLVLALVMGAAVAPSMANTVERNPMTEGDIAEIEDVVKPAAKSLAKGQPRFTTTSAGQNRRCRAIVERAQLGDVDPDDIATLRHQCG